MGRAAAGGDDPARRPGHRAPRGRPRDDAACPTSRAWSPTTASSSGPTWWSTRWDAARPRTPGSRTSARPRRSGRPRTAASRTTPATSPARSPPGGPGPSCAYGTVTLLTLPSDNDTWSVTVCGASRDVPLKNLRDPVCFDRVLHGFPAQGHWVDADAQPGVAVMAGVLDRIRSLVVDGSPVVTGFTAVGDAWACTNPSAGRGISIGLMHARALRDALREHPDDPAAFAHGVPAAHRGPGRALRARPAAHRPGPRRRDGRPAPRRTGACRRPRRGRLRRGGDGGPRGLPGAPRGRPRASPSRARSSPGPASPTPSRDGAERRPHRPPAPTAVSCWR